MSPPGRSNRDERLWCVATLAARLESALSELTHVASCVRVLQPELDPVLMDAVSNLWTLRDKVFLMAQSAEFEPQDEEHDEE
jgi:hypothetical protein